MKARSTTKRTAHVARKTGKSAAMSKTLREVAAIAFPNYKGRKIRLEVADHVDRQVEGGGTFYDDFLVSFSPRSVRHVQQPHAFTGSGNSRTEIPFGFAYVSKGTFMGKDSGVRIYIPPIDPATLSVAVDATLAAGAPTPAVTSMIGSALDGRGGLLRDVYVALVAQLAGELSSGEAAAPYEGSPASATSSKRRTAAQLDRDLDAALGPGWQRGIVQ